jgi:tartrate dehydrogenase/decarboxylase/D-malate dehydrogenase
MMLEHLGEKQAADAITTAIETMLRDGGPRTRDMGGQAGTVDVGKALAEAVARA